MGRIDEGRSEFARELGHGRGPEDRGRDEEDVRGGREDLPVHRPRGLRYREDHRVPPSVMCIVLASLLARRIYYRSSFCLLAPFEGCVPRFRSAYTSTYSARALSTCRLRRVVETCTSRSCR